MDAGDRSRCTGTPQDVADARIGRPGGTWRASWCEERVLKRGNPGVGRRGDVVSARGADDLGVGVGAEVVAGDHRERDWRNGRVGEKVHPADEPVVGGNENLSL